MAKKLGLSVDSSPTLKVANSIISSSNNNNNNNNNNNWKVHVGAKRKSEKSGAETTKKSQEEAKADFMTPPEKDDQYKGKRGFTGHFDVFSYVYFLLV